MKNEKTSVLHFATGAAFVILIALGLACATTPSAQIELGTNYRGYLQPPVSNERVIDTVGVRASTSFVCYDEEHSITRGQVLGATYQVGGEYALRNSAEAQNTATPYERHRDEVILDQLLNEAKSQYPNETVNIRNAKTFRHIPTNARVVEASTTYTSTGSYKNYRSEWDCFLYYTASVITTEPMPKPVTHTETFTKLGSTRADIFRLARIWIRDNTSSRRITVESENIDVGELIGTVTCAARTDQTYIITSKFVIDVMDAGVDMRFEPAILQRTDPAQQRVGNPEPIFLQSIADAAQKELVDFATSLRSYILAR